MRDKKDADLQALVGQATAGDKKALAALLLSVQDTVFNLSLRMLGTFGDAEDAAQDILLKIMTHLSSFRGESSFETWVFRIAVNHLKNYKKHMFAHRPLSFECYGEDIENGPVQDAPELGQEVDRELLAEELKLSCTNVMLQCLDGESRCIFILGTMFCLDSRIAGDILGMTPEAYRQRLSRTRRKMADFLGRYCGEYGGGKCRCRDRIHYAVHCHRIDPQRLEHTGAVEIPVEALLHVKRAMEEIDDLAQDFSFCKAYRCPEATRGFIQEVLASPAFSFVTNS